MLASGLALVVILSAGTMVQAQMSLEERVQRLEESAMMDESKNMEALWRNGLRIRTLDKSVEIRIGGRIQNDWNFIRPSDEIESSGLWPEDEPQDRVFFRRSRIYIRGTLHKYIRFKAEYNIIGAAEFTDVYLRFVKLPALGNLYLGKFKAPFGLEELTSSRFITFQERSLTDAFVLGREVGILIKNSAAGKRIHWATSLTHRDQDGYGTGSGDEHNFTFRLAATPFQASKTQLAHVGISYSLRGEDRTEFRYRARPEGRTKGVRLVSTSKTDTDSMTQYGLEGALVYGPWSLQAEYMNAMWDPAEGGDEPTFWGYYIMGSYFLTGESRTYSGGAFGRPKPTRKFDWKKGTMGAVEVAARASWLDLTENNGGEERNVTLGLNWYPNNNSRVTLNYVAAYVDGTKYDFEDELTTIVSMRFQVDF